MGKVTLLFAGKSYDTDVQNVRENQIVIFDGPYNMRQRMVVAGIAHTQSGYNYRLIDPETEESTCGSDPPCGQIRYRAIITTTSTLEFMDAAEVAALRTRADALKAEQVRRRRRKTRNGYAPSARSVRQIVPFTMPWPSSSANSMKANATPIRTISARVSCARLFSDFDLIPRDLFPEMRKAAARFEGTAHLG